MFCPNYKNKYVFDGFNEMIEAFGGKPMTEEEFRSGPLRNLRTGQDYLAMEAAYITYNRNGGNFLDETPLGKPSLLFLTLLSHFNGDKAKAIVAKSNAYSDEFMNWFGDWFTPLQVLDENIEYSPVSRVVDENGEPLVVWHHTNNSNLDEFRLDFENYFQKDGGTNKAFFFDENTHGTLNRKYDLPVYLNIKELSEYEGTKEDLHKQGTSYRAVVNKSAENNDAAGGVHMKDFDDNKLEHQSVWIAHSPNQIKHVENLGTWNPNDNNIYHLMIGQRGAKSIDNDENTSLRINNLVIAKQMESTGKNALTIKIATGWERGTDGKWRYEIPDVKLKEDGFGDYEIRSIVGNDRNHYVERDISEVIDLSSLPPIYKEELEYVGVIRIFDDFQEAERGSYGIEDGKVVFYINLGSDESAKSILAHELQHFIQDREGFALGGNPSMSTDAYLKQKGIYDEYQKLLNSVGEYTRTVQKILSQDKDYMKYEQILYGIDRLLDMIDTDNESEEDVDDFIKSQIPEWERGVNYMLLAELRKEYLLKQHKSELDEAMKKGNEANKKLSAIQSSIPSSYNLYQRLAGEAEARAVGRRTSLSKEEKAASLLKDDIYKDVAEEDLIFLYDHQYILSQEDISYFTQASFVSSFGQELSQKLMNGETVSSRDLMLAMLSSGIFHSVDNKLAKALSLHDVPVRIGYSMKNGELAKTVTDGAASVIFINPNELNQVSKGYVGVTLMHELVHAVTVDIINHPKTLADFEFVKANRDVFNKITSYIKHLDVHSKNVVDGMYALTNEKEFAACFASDPVVRALICGLAEKIDRLNRKSNILSALKQLVNKIVKAFGKRAVFSNNSLMSDIADYEKTLTDYLIGAPTIERGNTDNSKLKQVYANTSKSILNHEDFIESMKMLEKMQEVEKNYLATSGVQVHRIEEVLEMLNTRVQALKASLLDSVEKGRLISTTENQLEMFVIDEAGKYNAILNLLKTAVPAMIETVDKLRNIRREHGVFTNSDYMREMHANVGMYNKAFDTLESILVDRSNKIRIVEEYNRTLLSDQEKLTLDDINAMEQSLKNAKSFSEEAIHVLEYMLKENGIHTLKKKAKEVGYKGIDKYIDALNGNSVIDDISSLELLGGASDASANDAVRAISYMINTALNKAQFATQDKETDLLKLQKNLKRGEKGWHLYETDENGNFTGYLVRDLNFGKFKRDYVQAILNINRDLINHFGLVTLSIDNRVAPDGEAGKRTADIKIKDGSGNVTIKTYTAKLYFEEKKDEWLNSHCERKYKPEYYEHYSKLPQRIKDQLGAIRTQIEAITSNYKDLYDAEGVPHYEQLSDEDWEKLNNLWERRRFLRSPINEYGFEREGQDREDAEALAKLYEDLYCVPNPFKKKRDSTRKEKQYKKQLWEDARNKVIAKYGKDSEELKKWDQRNSIRKLKENEFGEALVFLEIEKEFGDYKINYGEEYEKLKLQKKDILSKYRMLNGEYDANSIPQVLLNALIELDRKMYSERYKSRGTDGQRIAKFKEVWDKYIKYIDTEQLIKAKEAARKEALRQLAEIEDIDDETTEKELMNIILGNTYGHISFDDDLFDIEGTFVPYSWLLRMEAVDEEFMEIAPNDAWIDKLESDLLNHNFDESYNMSYVPKRELYDNEENYAKIFGEKDKNGVRHGGSKTLLALYKGIFDTIHEANQMLNREFADDYLLPLQECTAMERLYRKSTYKSFWGFLLRIFGFGRIIGLSEDPNDTEINTAYQEQSAGRTLSISGVYPDGREFHVIPTPFTRPLEHPELISKDIVGITRDYYLMSSRYKERSIIRDDCELILDLIRNLEFKNSDRFGKLRKTTDKLRLTGGNKEQSNTFNFAKKLIERDLYDIQRDPVVIFGIDFTKILSLLKRFTTARNLGMNPKVALVGFFTTMFTHTINGIVGYKYSMSDMFNAGIIAMNEFGSNFAGARFIGDRLTKNKLILLLEMLDMSDQSGRKTEHSNRNRILLALYKNSTFGIMSAADIYSKATIAVATLLSYRLVDGLFITKHMIEEKRLTVGEEEYKRLMREFKKSKVNAYSIFEGDSKAWKLKVNSNDTSLKVKEEYKAAWEKIKNTAANKAIKNAEQADGMATRLQKAMMTRNALGAFVLIHRQYIPLMLQQTWGKRVYDFDAEEYKGGLFRTLFSYCRNLWASNALAAAGAGAFIGLAFGGFSPIFLAGCGTISMATSLAYNIKHRNDKKSLKDVNKDFFGMGLGEVLNPFGVKFAAVTEGQNQVDYDNLIANAYQIRQTFYEVMLINFAIAPIANLLAACADNVDKDDDRWKWLLLQTLAYWARAILFETNSKYNLIDILNNVKSATAATSVTDALLTFTSGMGTSFFMSTLGYGRNYSSQSLVAWIYRTALIFFSEDEDIAEEEGIIQNGTYKGYSEGFRNFMKTIPAHNIFEQFIDPSAKRRYHETQVMKLDKFERRSWLYDWIWGYEDEYDE